MEINNNKYECINTIYFQISNNFCFIFKLNENEFVTFSYCDKCLKFWNSNDNSNISTINNIEIVYHFIILVVTDYTNWMMIFYVSREWDFI